MSKLAAAACLAAIAFAGPTSADHPKDDRNKIKRKFKFETKHNEIKIQAETDNKVENIKDKLDFQINLGKHGILSQFQYSLDDKGEKGRADDYKSKTKMQVKVYKIYEWRDLDGDGEFDPDEDEIVQSFYARSGNRMFDKDEPDWKPIRKQRVHLKDDAAADAIANVTKFELSNARETFGIVGHYSGAPVKFTETARDNKTVVTYDLNSNALKYDIWANNFPFNATDTGLAMEVRFQSSFKVKARENAKTNVVIEAADESGNESAMFDWSRTVLCDGVNSPVVVTPIKEMTDAQKDDDSDYQKGTLRAFFALAPGKQCGLYYWDPEFGLGFPNEALNPAATAAPAAAASLAALALAYIWA